MTDTQLFIKKHITKLIPNFEKLDFRANVSDSTYSIEFFITCNGVKSQCFDLVDEGKIEETELDKEMELIAKFIRKSSAYKHGEINEVVFAL